LATRDVRYELLEAAPVADEETYLLHMSGFVESFVLPARRERWLHILTRRPKRASRDSHKLRNDLDYSKCSRQDCVIDPEIKKDGVYHDFHGDPHILSPAAAERVGYGCDAIFSVVPGRLAVYFFHECQSWLCRR
jgi:hypothetical protein